MNCSASSNTRSFKVITAGNAMSGKSCLIKRFCEDQFVAPYYQTIGIDYGVYEKESVTKQVLRAEWWDVGGQPYYYPIRSEFYGHIDAVLIVPGRGSVYSSLIMVFDVTSRGSFEALPGWYNEVMKLNNSTRTDIVGFVVGNKCDRSSDRVISYQDAHQLADSFRFQYIETSAKTGKNIQYLFDQVFELCQKQ